MAAQEQSAHPRKLLSHLEELQLVVWLLLVTLTPLWVNLWGQQPFELSKVFLARTLIWLLVALVTAESLLTGRSLRRAFFANPLLAPAALLALVILLATIYGSSRQLSLWGSYERGQGALTLLSYLILFLVAAARFGRLSRVRLLVSAMAATAVPLVLIALVQKAGWNPFGLVSDARSPVFATLGRANFLGAYLVILLPLTLALLLTTRRRKLRLLWGLLFTAEVGVIGLTAARGAWLAGAAAVSLFALLSWLPRPACRQGLLAWVGLLLSACAGPLTVLALGQHGAGSIAARLAIWQGTIELVKQRPFLGYGPDALGLIFPRVYPPQLVYYQGREFFVDRAHNLFLDWSAIAGIPGMLIFLLILSAFTAIALRGLRRTPRALSTPRAHSTKARQKRIFLAAILTAVLANCVNNLVSFDVTPTAVATWLLMGVGIALVAPAPACSKTGTVGLSVGRWAQVGVLMVIAGLAIWQLNGRPLLADSAARAAHQHTQRGEWREAHAAAQKAAAYWPVEAAHHLLLSQSNWNLALHEPASASTRIGQAAAALQTARQMRPDDPVMWLHSAQFYAAAARRFGSDTGHLVHESYRQAQALAPNQAAIYSAWGHFYLQEDNPQMAAFMLRQAVALDETDDLAQAYLAEAELALKRRDKLPAASKK